MPEKTIDLSECHREPIHIPGSIQSWGMLIAFDEKLIVRHLSQNFTQRSEGATEPWHNQTIHSFFSPSVVDLILTKLTQAKVSEVTFEVTSADSFSARMYWESDIYILELEKFVPLEPGYISNLQYLVSRIQAADSLENLFEVTVEGVKELSGYEKVMVYKFHTDEHGEVIAEAKAEGIDSFFGYHYPASDIPSQARELFLRSWVRMIADVRSVPVYLESEPPRPLDLSRASLRSSSPVHLEYLRNMKVEASLTVSLIVDGNLWGLIACHHYSSSCYQGLLMRQSCEILGRMISAEIELRSVRDREASRKKVNELKDLTSDNPIAELFLRSDAVLDLMKPDTTGCAAYYDEKWYLAGVTPTPEQLQRLILWLDQHTEGTPVFTTESLPTLFPEASAYHTIGCGILSIALKKDTKDFIIWFKPEVIRTIKWAGDPLKAGSLSDGKICPRKSFSDYLMDVHMHSPVWTTCQKDQSAMVRTRILDLELHKLVKHETQARKTAESLVEELNSKARELEEQRLKSIYSAKMASLGEMASGVAHEVNNPLAIITSSCLRLKHQITEANPDLSEMKICVDQIKETALRISRIVSGLNFFLRDSTDGKKQPTLVTDILNEVESVSSERLTAMGCRFEVSAPPGISLFCQPVAIAQVLMNLMNNAFDALEGQKSPWINIDVRAAGAKVIIVFTDSGNGIAPDLRKKIMDPFFSTKPGGKGAGLGLSMAQKIIAEHGGELYLSPDSTNTSFVIELPGMPS